MLTHQEICAAQNARNHGYADKYMAPHHQKPDFTKSVDNVTVADVAPYEDQWFKIVDRVGLPITAGDQA